MPTKRGALDVNPETGEVVRSAQIRNFQFPDTIDLSGSRSLEDVAGKSVPWLNLRDHEELDGQALAILGVELMPGTIPDNEGYVHDYVRIACVALDDKGNEPMVIYTGAAQVVERCLKIINSVSPEQPIRATLRQVGRAWVIE